MIGHNKEERLLRRVKMDAVSAQGVWLSQFPTGTPSGHGVNNQAAGSLYALLLMEEMQRDRERRRRGVRRKETNRERRVRLMNEVWRRLIQQARDDEALLLVL